jgi:hypothetical protein
VDNQASEHQAPENGATAPSRVVITFPGRGLADCTISAEGVTAGQLMAAAYWLDAWLRSQLGGAADRVQAQGLVIPQGFPGTPGWRG